MEWDRKQLVSGGVGALLGACTVMGIGSLNDSKNHATRPSGHRSKQVLYDRVKQNVDGDVYITEKGKKYHSEGCFILQRSDVKKQVSSSDAINVGYEPCRKCKP